MRKSERWRKCIGKGELTAEAVQVMEQDAITSLVIVDDTERVEGAIHFHDLLRAGVV